MSTSYTFVAMQARLCLLLGGYWRDAAFAAGDAPLTEQQLLDDFVTVNNRLLADVVRAREMHHSEEPSADGHTAASVGCRLIEAIRDRWATAGTASPRGSWRASQQDDSGVASAAAHMQLPPGVVERIDEAAGEAAAVAAAAVACADRSSRDV